MMAHDHDTWADWIGELVQLPGIAGYEDDIARHMAAQLRQHTDRVSIDPLGNVIARFGDGDAPPLAVLAHMDTVGLLVNRHLGDDTVGVVRVGGVNLKALPGTPVSVGGRPGLIGVRSQHQAGSSDSLPTDEQLYLHTAAARDIEITTPVWYATRPQRSGDWLAAPYLDNRAGCAVLLALAQHLAGAALPRPVCLIGTVQEETTCAGAHHALAQVRPAAALFVDGTVSYDTPETRGRGSVVGGGGPVLTAFLYVSGLNGWHAHPGLRAHLKQVAQAGGLPYQQDAVHGLMSDARVVTALAIPAAIVGIPLRGKHAPLELVHLADVAHTLALLRAAVAAPLPDLRRGR
jgi:putative aminopeptidase FrvX